MKLQAPFNSQVFVVVFGSIVAGSLLLLIQIGNSFWQSCLISSAIGLGLLGFLFLLRSAWPFMQRWGLIIPYVPLILLVTGMLMLAACWWSRVLPGIVAGGFVAVTGAILRLKK